MNTIKCTMDSRWMAGVESACFTVYSPSGNYVRIDKRKTDKLNDTQRELMWKCANAYNGASNTPIELTVDEMSQLVTIANIAGSVHISARPVRK